MKTAKEIQTDFLALVANSPMAKSISGKVYRKGYRPRDSQLEDITVAFVSGLPTQIESGVVAICIYVPDIDSFDNGVLVEDGTRTDELEKMCRNWIDTNPASGTDYTIELQTTIATVEDEAIHQHFVSLMIKYRHFE